MILYNVDDPIEIPPFLRRSSKAVYQLTVPEEKTNLPSTETGAVAMAENVAEAMLDDTTHADPLAIKSRALAAMHLCDEKEWKNAKHQFFYAAMCCDYRWTQDNPRAGQGARTDKVPNERTSVGVDEVPDARTDVSPSTARRMHEAYDGVTPDDLRKAKEEADAKGEAVTRASVQEAAGDPEAIKRKALLTAKRRTPKPSPLQDQMGFLREHIEMLTAENAELRARLAEVAAEIDDEITEDDAKAEARKARAEISRMNTILNKSNSELREQLETAKAEATHWKTYAGELEAALQRKQTEGD